MLNAVLALNELDTTVFDSPSLGASPRVDAGYVTVPDAHLLFTGEFKRVGTNDLKIVGEDGESFFIPDYFAADKRPHLMSPEGATLSPHVVEALAGPLAPGQHAQAGTPAASGQPVIGRVDAVTGSATVVRNGVSVALNVGDNVRQGDVVQTSGSSSVAIVLADGSTFSLNANARMVLDSLVYNAGGTGNSALVSLVQGTFSFVAGQVAKTGEMRVETPVATMGIRGTAVLVEISSTDGQTKFSVMVEPDGSTGSFNLYNKTTGALIGTVNNSQVGWVLTPSGPLQVLAQQVQKTPGELQQELGIVQQIFTIFNNNQQNPFTPPATDPERRGDDQKTPTKTDTAQAGGSGETFTVTVPVPTPDNPRPADVTLNVTVTPVATNTTPPTTTVPGTPPTTGIPTPTPTGPSILDFSNATAPQNIAGTINDDTIIGSQFGDTIDAGAGNDNVSAGAGDDTIIGSHGEGDDAYDGGADFDTISFVSANGVVFHLNETLLPDGTKQSRANSFFSGADTFINIERIVASPGNDIFNVHLDGGWVLDGRGGFDTLSLANRSEGIVATLGVATVDEQNVLQGNVTGALLGTVATSNIESIVGSTGDDTFIINDLAGWSALNDSAGWEMKGGAGADTLQINGATGFTYDLNAVDFFGTTFSTIDIAVGQLRFSGIENISAGAGNDVFIVRDLTGFTINAGEGIDIVRFANGIDILDGPGGPEISNFEIVDLVTDSEQNVVHFDLGDLNSIGNAAPLRILGGTNDIIQITNAFGIGATFSKTGNNVLSDGVFADGLTDGVLFDVYQVTIGDGQYQVYVQDGVQIPLPGAQDDQAAMTENEILFVDVLANDAEGLGTTKTLQSLGAVTIDGPDGVLLGNPAIVIEDGQIRVTPGTAFDALAAGETATITIPYTMQTGTGEALSAVATVTVTGTNDAPYFSVLPQGYQSIGATNPNSSFEGLSALQLTTFGATTAQIETFLQLNSGTIASISAQQSPSGAHLTPTEGAAIAFDLVLAEGESISFSWNLESPEYKPFNDFAFVSLAPTFGAKLADIFAIGDNDPAGRHSSGWQEYVFTATDAGVHRLGIGVVDTGDQQVDSFLYISGFSGIGFRRSTTEDGAAETFNLLNGAFDPDTNDVLTATNIVATGTNHLGIAIDITGAVTINGNEVTIDPAIFSALSNEESVTVVVNYDVSDGHTVRHNSATLVIVGADNNDAPIASDDSVATTEDSAPVVFSVTENDSDGDALEAVNISALSDPALGTLVYDGDSHQFTFTPAANASGSTTFTYQATDGELTSNTATVTINVASVNDAPVITAADATGSVSAGSPISTVAAGYLTAGHNLINGLGGTAGFGTSALAANDDGSTGTIDITSVFGEQGLNFFGTHYTSFFINNNGNITFGGPLGSYTPSQIAGNNLKIIAPFWADVDTFGGATAYTPDGNSTGSNLVYYDLDSKAGVVTITWDDVGYYSSQTNKLNAFQLQLIDRGDGNFDIVFRYEDINWTTGNASGGSGGLGGTPARAGYTAGDGNPAHYFELHSLPSAERQAAMLALEDTAGNTGIAGVHVFEVRSGDVGTPTSVGTFEFSDADIGDTHAVSSAFDPESSSQAAPFGVLSVALTRESAAGIDGLVTWQYSADPALVDALAPGTVLTEVFNVTISDGQGGTVTQSVTITVNGPKDDAVVLTVQADGGFDTTSIFEPLLFADVIDSDTSHISLHYVGLLESSHDDLFFEITGRDLIFTPEDQDSRLSGGTITGMSVSGVGDGAPVPLATFAGFNIDAVEIQQAIEVFDETGNDSAFNGAFLAHAYRATGGEGADVLASGYRNDTLTGGTGPDTFVFWAGNGQDIITDMTLGDRQQNPDADLIVLDGFGYDDVSDLTVVDNGQGFVRIVLGQEQSIDLAGIAHGTALTNHNFAFGSGLLV